GLNPRAVHNGALDRIGQRAEQIIRIAEGARAETAAIPVAIGITLLRIIIGELRHQMLGDRQAEADGRALHIIVIAAIRALLLEDVEPGRHAATQEIGLGEGELIVAAVLAATEGQADILAASEEIVLGDAELGRRSRRLAARRITGADRELARRFL